ncbi:M16 family metallopeptidase [Ramlibacter sp. MAHUQ-53]|uniref:M16 family metallopeptidase n=1 Tax=unclassified Ramlibacter TaxID=2617605 RepID=UPI00363319FD
MKPLLKRLLLACSLSLGFIGPAPASTAPPAEAPVPISRFTLSNGMTLVVKPDRRAPTAIHMLWVRVGSIDEVDGASGIAHVLEHMLFKGTRSLKPGEYSRRIAALGGRDNAFTTRDVTGYHEQIPVAKLEEVMRLEADRFANNQWPDDEFRRELEVVKEERRLRVEDQPRSRFFEVMNAAVWTVSPYRRPIIGWMTDLEALTPEEVRAFYHRWYVPANAAVVVVGDVDPAQVLRMAERHYGRIPAGPVPARKPLAEPPQAGLRRVEVRVPADQAFVAMQYKVPKLASLEAGAAHDDAIALTVLAGILDGYPGARLDRALTQGPDRVADSVGASNGLWGRGPQVFALTGVPATGKTPEQVEAALREQVARIARDGVTEAELQRVKTRWISAEVYKLDSIFGQARELGIYWTLGLPLDANEQLIRRLREVTAAQVQSVAARYFGDDQLTVGYLRPMPREGAASRPRTAPSGLRH